MHVTVDSRGQREVAAGEIRSNPESRGGGRPAVRAVNLAHGVARNGVGPDEAVDAGEADVPRGPFGEGRGGVGFGRESLPVTRSASIPVGQQSGVRPVR